MSIVIADRLQLQTATRQATVRMLEAFAIDTGRKLQVYAGRPRTIAPPTAFVDRLRERTVYPGQIRQRTCTAEVVIVHGIYDSAEAAANKDATMDAFADWVDARVHEVYGNTTIGVVETFDEPDYIPTWLPVAEQKVWYATRLALEVFAGD